MKISVLSNKNKNGCPEKWNRVSPFEVQSRRLYLELESSICLQSRGHFMYRRNAIVFVKGQTLFVYVIASLRAFLPIEIHCYVICITVRELLLFIYDHDCSFHMFIY